MNQVTNEFCSLFSEEFSEDYFLLHVFCDLWEKMMWNQV